jgi:RNA polymerase sigma factor (sigma-70 family)
MKGNEQVWEGFGKKVGRLSRVRENFWRLAKTTGAGSWSGEGVRLNEEARVVAALDGHPVGSSVLKDYRRMVIIRNELVEDLMPIIRRKARAFAQRFALHEVEEDLVNEGVYGVLQWSQHVTLDKAGTVYAAFSYAERWISQAMARYLKDEKQIELKTVSIWSNRESEDGLSLIDQIPSEAPSPEEEANHRQNFQRFLERLGKNPDQLEVAKMCLEGRTDTEIASVKGHMSLNEIRRICSETKSATLVRW